MTTPKWTAQEESTQTDMIKLYTNPNCGPCVTVKSWLDKNNLKYDQLQAGEHMDYLQSIGAKSTPVVVSGDKVIHGFNMAALKELL